MVSVGDMQMVDPDGPYAELMQRLLEATADDLRLVFQYDSESVDIAFLREDFLSEDMVPRVDELHSRAKIIETMPTEDTQAVYGDLEANVTVHEDVFVLHFFGTEGDGLVAVVDRGDGSVIRSIF
ncbi:hypothetical protein HTSR_1273 [Halodesulfurarchaeum formicicum]|uniref:Uncharacterized protein n=1 Tax=Halodesulfurarchaeum formicicum TaxID=1873524 RepID=A0A1D8S517_9EURY|nr:hypothetical protein [Halodesulfurarchaeum formicicum]AOW80450.1 hypothetical protein HTSR_1273 [Halodesulfurarchaeum formicicum]APE95789.1 hypothetical protein HSR6_1346 [Halodesulfurarchaeum formicicum]